MNASISFLNGLWRNHAPGFVQGLAMLALAAGLGTWAAILLAPSPAPQPPVLAASMAPQLDTSAVAGWFGGGTSRIRVALVGLIASEQQGAALLTIDGGKPQAFRTGQTLAPGVTLARVSTDRVEIDQDGATETLMAPANPDAIIQGFVPVR